MRRFTLSLLAAAIACGGGFTDPEPQVIGSACPSATPSVTRSAGQTTVSIPHTDVVETAGKRPDGTMYVATRTLTCRPIVCTYTDSRAGLGDGALIAACTAGPPG